MSLPISSTCSCFSPHDFVHILASSVLYLLGPILVVVTFSLLFCLSWTFWNVILPLRFGSYDHTRSPRALIHQGFVVFVLINIIFNYIMCVITRNGHKSQRYKTVVKELARATGFHYPETEEQISAWRKELHNTLILKTRQRILEERYEHRRECGLLMLEDEGTLQEGGYHDGRLDIESATIVDGGVGGSAAAATAHNLNYDGMQEARSLNHDISSSTPIDTHVLTGTTSSASVSSSCVATSVSTQHSSFIKKRRNGRGLDAPPCLSEESSKPQSHQQFQSVHRSRSWNHGRSWMTLGPYDWSYCIRSQLPKPPRSHYDHVTQSLVLNMDHYCPWMFNCIGYFNYRYFVNFLIYVAMGMFYGALVSFHPFMMIDSLEYKEQIMKSKELFMSKINFGSDENVVDFGKQSAFRYSHVQHLIPNVPTPNEATPIAFSFMMCFAVGLSVVVLLGFHLYLILSAQTTIEFHGNRMKKQQCRIRGEEFYNPYDIGPRRNIEQIWGRWGKNGQGSWFLLWTVLLPSIRENEFLPIPIKGDEGLRKHWNKDNCVHIPSDSEVTKGDDDVHLPCIVLSKDNLNSV